MADELPGALTGSSYYDRLVFQDDSFFDTWKTRLAARNYALVKVTIKDDSFAHIQPFTRTLNVDPDKTRYIHFLHERHHTRQFIRLERQGYILSSTLWDANHHMTKIHRWLELGAYEYLERLGRLHQFSNPFMHYLYLQKDDYWNRRLRRNYLESQSLRQKFKRIWR